MMRAPPRSPELEIAASTGCHIHDYHLVHYVGVAALLAGDDKRATENLLSMARMPASQTASGHLPVPAICGELCLV